MRKTLILGISTLASFAIGASEIRSVPGEIIVKFKTGQKNHFFNSKGFSKLNLRPDREIKLSYTTLSVLKVGDEKSLTNALSNLNQNADIEYAEPNYIYSTQVEPIARPLVYKKVEASPFVDLTAPTPDDQNFKYLWGLRNTGYNEPNGKVGVEGADVNALNAWDLTKGSKNIRIAIIDTGIDYNHPDLKDNVDAKSGFNFVTNTPDAMDDNGHGTHCAGTIGATHNNKLGVSGVMSDVTMIPLKFLDANGSGSLEGAVRAIDYATNLNVDLMSNSWGGGGRSETLYEAIKRAAAKGIVFTAAAGNSAQNNDAIASYPASYDSPNIVAVAALTAQNDLASFSSYGKNSVHIAAPGHNILSTYRGGGYQVMSGTSMATPHVSGVIGLLLAKEGRLSLDVLRERVVMTGVPVSALKGRTQTASRIDAYNLLTDTRPSRSGPQAGKWVSVKLSDIFESAHPYTNNLNIPKTITYPGAKFIRLKIAQYDFETGYDYLRIADKSGVALEKVTGRGANYTSDYVEGDTINVNFVTDRSVTRWGFKIDEIEVQ